MLFAEMDQVFFSYKRFATDIDVHVDTELFSFDQPTSVALIKKLTARVLATLGSTSVKFCGYRNNKDVPGFRLIHGSFFAGKEIHLCKKLVILIAVSHSDNDSQAAGRYVLQCNGAYILRPEVHSLQRKVYFSGSL